MQIISTLILTIVLGGYGLVIAEERVRLKKSLIMITVTSFIWLLMGASDLIEQSMLSSAFQNEFLAFSEIFFFIVVALIYIHSLEHYGFFSFIEKKVLAYSSTSTGLFWISGLFAFCLSPFLDNLTTALVLGQVVIGFFPNTPQVLNLLLLNIVLASNAGGVFSPFGDLTSLMLWQSGFVSAQDFLALFVPALVSYLIPALLCSVFLEKKKLNLHHKQTMRTELWPIFGLAFFITIMISVIAQHYYEIPAVFGLIAGLGLLGLIERFLVPPSSDHDVFVRFQHIPWDTLLFFYGIMLSVQALSLLGWLEYFAHFLYTDLSALLNLQGTLSSVIGHSMIGLISSVIDNIPMMATVLKMDLDFSKGSWLLLALTTGIGGSLLSIGSASGIALMGLSLGQYNFRTHLAYSPAIALGYILAIVVHCILNKGLFI